MIKGTHNSLTRYEMLGWQRLFQWLFNPLSKCQNKTIEEQFREGVRLFDIQIAELDNQWYSSHGFIWYDTYPDVILDCLDYVAMSKNIKIGILLGLDNHSRLTNRPPFEKERFLQLVSNFNSHFPNLTLVRAYIEKPWQVIYNNEEISSNMFEKYWSLGWAKSMQKHWWQFYYYFPIPRFWKWIYGKQWDKEAEESGKTYYITDFI